MHIRKKPGIDIDVLSISVYVFSLVRQHTSKILSRVYGSVTNNYGFWIT
jgi:uncharacterized membrane protein